MCTSNMPTAVMSPTGVVEATTSRPSCSTTMDDRGDFVDSEDEGDIEEVAENPNLYPEGLLYPICIGEIVADRYRIDHKLGHGSFSTVWMAYDTVRKVEVALKILMHGDAAEREYRAQQDIVQTVLDTTHLLLYKDTFFLHSPHGEHRVLVFPLQGPNLRDYPRKAPVATRMSFSVQLLQALKSLHSSGFVHRDLNSANVMYSLQPLENGSTTSKYASLGRPQKMRLFTEQWKEGELVMPMQPHESLVGDTILLGDFGLARKAGTPVALKLQSPATYCAPERLHGVDPSFASDMWSYMCLFFELYTTACLFPGSGYTSVVSSMVNTLGPLPVSWKGTYYARAACDTAWYDQDRQLEPTTALKAKIMRLRPDISAMELELVMSILRQGLSYHPEHRLMAAQLLEDASFKALMGIYGF